ncbi:hypothetical protein CDD83_3439 [Cordyceps sp. RAO-2017]|nr:hypothetical protein CDD83_3439 [Cordyceps sp. RAO-2017]
MAAVVAVATFNAKPELSADPEVLEAVEESVRLLDDELRRGRVIYGVNTGFGGSADTRTSKLDDLQSALLQLVNVGILLPSDKGISSPDELGPGMQAWRGHALPNSVVKGMMLVRSNSLMRGHSGVRVEVIRAVLALLQHDVAPIVPLRGSISASGDLMPLSYIAGLLEGNPDVHVRLGSEGRPATLTADKALESLGIERFRLRAKESLGITNGTATSTAAAAIALYQAHQLAVLTQILTATATEALLGSTLNYAPSISEARPHPGQGEAAANILAFLAGSGLTEDAQRTTSLAQDRYALRTAPQWIGPALERLMLAHQQVQIEINSTTDNPLIDIERRTILSGGNFQAASVTSAMELASSSLQSLGKLMFAQCTELLNSATNKDLPPNLCSDDPSTSFTTKGLDISMAAYMSELAHLAHPISSHVQNAEMGNQPVNSMALVAARIALESVEVLSLMAATHIYILCQALDLRCLHLEFVKEAEPAVGAIARDCFGSMVGAHDIHQVCDKIWQALVEKWLSLSHYDLADRCPMAVRETAGLVLDIVSSSSRSADAGRGPVLDAIQAYRTRTAKVLHDKFTVARSAFLDEPSTPRYLGAASRVLYAFVRNQLNIPMHRGLMDHPTLAASRADRNGQQPRTIGTMTSEIYLALRNGHLYDAVLELASTA